MRRLLLVLAMVVMAFGVEARGPMYVVNGMVVESIDHIPHEDIESIDVLPADDETIALWGDAAMEGVIVVSLRYDTPASFVAEGCDNFTDYLAKHVRWKDSMPCERVSLRIRVDAEGRATIGEILESTSRQFLKRVEQAIAEAPLWQSAMRDGKPVDSIHLVNLQLPEGATMPVERVIIML